MGHGAKYAVIWLVHPEGTRVGFGQSQHNRAIHIIHMIHITHGYGLQRSREDGNEIAALQVCGKFGVLLFVLWSLHQ